MTTTPVAVNGHKPVSGSGVNHRARTRLYRDGIRVSQIEGILLILAMLLPQLIIVLPGVD